MRLLFLFVSIVLIEYPSITYGNGQDSTYDVEPSIRPAANFVAKIDSQTNSIQLINNSTEVIEDYVGNTSDNSIGADRIIALIASIAALLTSIAVLLSLLEMKKQRRSSYYPDLLFGNCIYTIEVDKNNLMNSEWLRADEPQDEKAEQIAERQKLELDCYNIGLGPAKVLRVEWIFDFQDIIRQLSSHYSADELLIAHTRNGWLDFSGERIGSLMLNLNSDLKQEKEFILPVSVISEPTKIRIPSSYLILSLIYHVWHVDSWDREKATRMIPELKPLEVKIDYLDIENNQHVIRYLIEFNVSMMAHGEDGKMVEVKGYVEPKRSL